MICTCIKKMGKRFQKGECYEYEIASVLNMTYTVYDKEYLPEELTFEEFQKYFNKST